ncbi:MAG: polysaccharide biosynthesis tyrosine autokinase [Neisseria sp.]|uniref:polysaccharide biosynthesis tyrosine autokinase n=1 Tax=Neisseria sp. TaxID=192066 RepID=UPI0026DBDCD8|nr:polysaccharide biosynthesis tyrosine autokinase [Neisseria sp.]MDO4641780.1 polysaccharide biosynthesis tyrosine autokinase [Neisseria sp.]
MTNKSTQTFESSIDLRQLMTILYRHKLPIGTAVAAGFIIGGLYSMSAEPVYRADALLAVEAQNNQILPQLNNANVPQRSGINGTGSDAEIDLIKSRSVIGQTVDNLQLDLEIQPMYTPIIGATLAKFNSSGQPQLKIERMTVPEDFENKKFTLDVKSPSAYTLTTPDGDNLEGKVGKPLKIGTGELVVNQLVADAGQSFSITKLSRLRAINSVNDNLSANTQSEAGSLITLSYNGSDRKQIEMVLNHIIDNYVSQNKNRDVQMATSGLAFISEELPRLKQSLQEAETKLNQYRTHTGSVDIPSEAQGALRSLTDIETQITTLRAEEAGMSELYTPEHPTYKSVRDRLKVLETAKERINRQISTLPQTEQEVIRLNRDVEINQATYVQLLNRQQELNILKASSQGNIRVIDSAAAEEKPFKPRRAMITLLSAVAAGLLASSLFVLRAIARPTIKVSDDIRAMGYNLIATIPVSNTQLKADKRYTRLSTSKSKRPQYLLANIHTNDVAVETIRALRTNLHFATINNKSSMIMIAGTTPDVGKSFVSSNLAAVTAQAGSRVLLVDADLRRGMLHHSFGLSEENGLAEILDGSLSLDSCIKKTDVPGLDFISRGHSPQSPSEMLMSDKFKEFITMAKDKYDYVIIDTPPVLAVTDSSVIGRIADLNLLIARYRKTSHDELEDSMTRLNNAGIKVEGIIFNGVERTARNYYQYQAYTGK